jgi:hypothetical protein
MNLNRNTSDNELLSITSKLMEQMEANKVQIERLQNAQHDIQFDLRECLVRLDERAIDVAEELNKLNQSAMV